MNIPGQGTTSSEPIHPDDIVKQAEMASDRLQEVTGEIAATIFGQEQVVEQALITILAGGHGLLVGVPGLAKTKLVETLGIVLGLNTGRIQFTPDLMPADILGSEVLEESESGKRHFRFLQGPVFTQLLMADEINRASPRTQSALLQAMQEYHVTIAGQHHTLPSPFHVLATQNPLEQEGTYPLPEAQLDRFLMQIDVHYPDFEAEKQILLDTTSAAPKAARAVLNIEELQHMQRLLRHIPVSNSVMDAILHLVRSARPDQAAEGASLHKSIAWGPGPRASQALMLTVRARALLQKRLAPSIEDVLALAEPVLKHRMALSFTAKAEGVELSTLLDELKKPLLAPV
ncbi:AAA family ATPase [Polycladidibacter stylochi]|uniref:AAA family ATPase n=1 Tax=Polycladidibacter stylochi TaxID=1807766 RepID=UPI000829DC10|nr:MoxR family ATPase [Pseudovibrio stylochi]